MSSLLKRAVSLVIIRLKKLLDSDWLRAMQFKCNTSVNCNEDKTKTRRLPEANRCISKNAVDRAKPSEDFRISYETFWILPIVSEDHPNASEDFRRLATISGHLRRSPDILEAFPSFGRSRAMPSVYLSSQCMVRVGSVLLISNHMIFLVQFGINKHLYIFSKTTNCTRPTGPCNFVGLWKNLLVLIYSKLHSKSCDYLYLNKSFFIPQLVELAVI